MLIKLKLLTLFLHLHHLFHWTGGAVGLGQPTLVINKGGAATAALLSKAPAHPQIRHVRKVLLWANGIIGIYSNSVAVKKHQKKKEKKHF